MYVGQMRHRRVDQLPKGEGRPGEDGWVREWVGEKGSKRRLRDERMAGTGAQVVIWPETQLFVPIWKIRRAES